MNIIRKLVCIAVLIGFGVITAQAQVRIGVIDYKKVVAGYWKTKEATVALKDRREDLLKELKGLGEDIKKGEDDYKKALEEANDQGVSGAERDKRKTTAESKLKSISDLKDRYREFDRNASANLNEQAQRMSERIDEKIRAVIAAHAKSNGLTLVLDVTARGQENRLLVVYSNGENDITDTIIEQLNSDAPADSSKSTGAKPDKK